MPASGGLTAFFFFTYKCLFELREAIDWLLVGRRWDLVFNEAQRFVS